MMLNPAQTFFQNEGGKTMGKGILKSAALLIMGLMGCGLSATAAAYAQLSATGATATLVQTGATQWTLTKTGALSSANSTVTWQINAVEQSTVPGRLRVEGQFLLSNTGSTAAPLGNVVVNLQTRSGNRWVTLASDVANATAGDAATSASIASKGSSEGAWSFTESAASGTLSFKDATTGAAFALVPQKVIAPGASRALRYRAEFDNTVLALPAGARVRAELIVSFGNAAPNSASAPSIDINGSGVLDADEAWVRSVPVRQTLTVPAAPSGATPTLSDTLADISTTGTVTFNNAQFSLGATSGTVTALVDRGTDGGTITNCAHLAGGGVDLETCRTIAVPGTPPPCTPGTAGCLWQTGNIVTYTQSDWGLDTSTAAALLVANWNAYYLNDLVVGGTFELHLTEPLTVYRFLPQSDAPGRLTGNVIDPTWTSAGELAGQVVALQINLDFSGAVLAASVDLGSLRVCNYGDVPALNNMTIQQVANLANFILGGGFAAITPEQAALALGDINNAFRAGAPSTFAQANLVNGACP